MAELLTEAQWQAVKHLRNGCILCGGVGTGKSRTALAYYYQQNGGDIHSKTFKRMTNPKDLYIITTAKKRDSCDWEAEMPPFEIFPGSRIYKNKVVVDSWNNIQKYVGVTDSFFIFDEQRVVGKGAWVKSFLKITKHNEWILLSATPGDTWMDYVPVFLANGFYRNRTEFNQMHVIFNPRVKFPKVEGYHNEGRLIHLRNMLLVDIPAEKKTVRHHEYIYTDYDRVLYKKLIKDRWDIWKDQPMKNASDLCLCLRKLVNSDESRQEELLALLDSHPRAIIFYNYDYELDILKHLRYVEETVIAEWNGHKHQEIPEGKRWVYLVQYTAGAEGWNCIATDTVIFYSQTYSYKVLSQACGRIDRMNTHFKDLYYYHFVSRSGIDISIKRALIEKKTFNENGFVQGMNRSKQKGD